MDFKYIENQTVDLFRILLEFHLVLEQKCRNEPGLTNCHSELVKATAESYALKVLFDSFLFYCL